MNLYKSGAYLRDLDRVAGDAVVRPLLEELDGASVFLTGATGLIVSAVADVLFRWNETGTAVVQVYIAARDSAKARARFSRYCDQPYFHYVKYDASRHNTFALGADYIIHGASNATPADFQAHQVDTLLDNFMGLYEILSYAEKAKARAVLFISSSEVYGRKETGAPFGENDYGFVDILGLRAAYPSAKRAAETLCACFSRERGLRTLIVRPGHIYGPTARRTDNRVSSQFAYAAAENRPLVLKSDGRQIRSYCYVLDAAAAILMVLLRGKSAQAYNISNPSSVITIRQMTEYLAAYAGVPVSFAVPSAAEKAAFNPMQNSSLNAEKLLALGYRGLFDAETGLAHTVRILREGME